MNEQKFARHTSFGPTGEITIYNAKKLFCLLVERVVDPRVDTVDMAEVSELDTCGLQLLLCTQKYLEEIGCQLRLINVPLQAQGLLGLYGLSHLCEEEG